MRLWYSKYSHYEMQEITSVLGSVWAHLPALIQAKLWFRLSLYYFLYILNKFINFAHIPVSQINIILIYKLKLSDTYGNVHIYEENW